MMKSPLNLTVLLAALMLLVTPALAQEKQAEQAAPTKAIGEKTMLAFYVDVTQIDTEMISGLGKMLMGLAQNEAIKGQDLALPIGDPQQIADMLTLLRGSFVQAGGEAMLMTVEMPQEESWSPPMALLAKTNGKFDAASMTALFRSMGEGETDATLEALGDGWQNIAMKSKEGQAVTLPLPKPDAVAFAAINKQLTQHKKPMLAVAFRMQDQMREMMDEAEKAAKNAQPGQEQDPQQQMAMGMMMGMFKPIRSLDTLGLSISQVEVGGMLVDAQMTFQDAQSAQQFANLYNSILMFAPVIMAGAAQEGQIQNLPDPATINQFFMKLRMNLAGNSLKLTLDQDFFDLAEKMAPLFEGLNDQGGAEDFDL